MPLNCSKQVWWSCCMEWSTILLFVDNGNLYGSKLLYDKQCLCKGDAHHQSLHHQPLMKLKYTKVFTIANTILPLTVEIPLILSELIGWSYCIEWSNNSVCRRQWLTWTARIEKCFRQMLELDVIFVSKLIFSFNRKCILEVPIS